MFDLFARAPYRKQGNTNVYHFIKVYDKKETNQQPDEEIRQGPKQKSFWCHEVWGPTSGTWEHSWFHKHRSSLKKDQEAVLLGFHGDFIIYSRLVKSMVIAN